MTQAPTPGPLSGDDVKLLVKGDLLRRTDGRISIHGLEYESGLSGTYLDGTTHANSPWSHFSFIGRPDADGWMPWSGGENPVPGKWCEWFFEHTGPYVGLSSDALWDRVTRFRLAPTAPVEASGSEREAIADVISHYSDWRTALMAADAAEEPPEDGSGKPGYWLHQIKVLDRVVSALSARPLALGGQHSGGEELVRIAYTFQDEIAWLREAAKYFSHRSTGGEDRAHWANVYNAENATKLADRLAALSTTPARAEADAMTLRKRATAAEARNAEVSMLVHRWMEAHDRLKAGLDYDLPSPADVPAEKARADRAESRIAELATLFGVCDGGRYLNDWKAALAAAPASPLPGGGWQDISTAPKDGTPLLAGSIHHSDREVVCWQDGLPSGSMDTDAEWEGWVNDGPQKDRFYASPRYFTHWQPLPTAPTGEPK